MFIPIPSFKVDASMGLGAGAGFVIGCFVPSIGRKVKSAIAKFVGKALTSVEAEAKKLEADAASKL